MLIYVVTKNSVSNAGVYVRLEVDTSDSCDIAFVTILARW